MSLTCDEPVFMASGYTYLTRNDFRMTPDAPPLIQEMVALPLLFMRLQVPPESEPDWQEVRQADFARSFIFAPGHNLRWMAFWSRLPVLLMGSLLVMAVFWWGRQLTGNIPALLSATLAAFSPNLLAHAKVATTDLGCTFFMFLSLWAFWKSCQTGKIQSWCLAGALTGLAILSKFTGLLLFICYAILFVSLWIGRRKDASAIPLLRGAALLVLIAVLVVGAGYNLSFNYTLFFKGLHGIYSNIRTPDYQYYLLGHMSEKPWWFYHLVAFVLKEPASNLALLVLAGSLTLGRRSDREILLFVLMPAFVVLASSCFDQANVGVRRILPALPFLYLFASQALKGVPSKVRIAAVLGLTLGSITETVRIYPDHLSYFSQVFGGPDRGINLLDDSNLDWGQDLIRLAEWQKRHPEARPIKLLYFGNAVPEAYGVATLPMRNEDLLSPEPGTYVMSAQSLITFRKIQKKTGVNLDWTSRFRFTERIGYTLYVYVFPQGPQ